MDLLDFKGGDCRFPLNDDLPYDFCGAAAVRGPYCKKHADLCYDPKVPKHWTGIAGMIHATEKTVQYVGKPGRGHRSDHRHTTIGAVSDRVSPIDEVFANSRIGEKPLLERML